MDISGPTDPFGQLPTLPTEGPKAADKSPQTTGPGSLPTQQGLPQDECQTLSEGRSLIQEFKTEPFAELSSLPAGQLAEAGPGAPGAPLQADPLKMVIRDHLVASHLQAGLEKSQAGTLPAGISQEGDSTLKWEARPIGLQPSGLPVAGGDAAVRHLPVDMQQTQSASDDAPGELPMASGGVRR